MRTIAPRQDVAHTLTEAYAEAEEEMGQMLKIAAHRRKCHMTGHRGCRRCKPEKCSECKTEALQGWDRQKHRLSREAGSFLKSHGLNPMDGSGEAVVPPSSGFTDEDRLLLLLLLMK
jgi:hypothetical protein